MNYIIFCIVIALGAFFWFIIRPRIELIKYAILKESAKKMSKDIGPLMAYPFMVFLELELDQIFKEEGYDGALKAIQGFGDRFKDNMTDALNGISEAEVNIKLPGNDMKTIPMKVKQPETGGTIYMGPPVIKLEDALEKAGWKNKKGYVVTVNGAELNGREPYITKNDVVIIKKEKE